MDKKPLEKNRNILGQKQRKVSKSSKQICPPAYGNGPPLFPTGILWTSSLVLPNACPYPGHFTFSIETILTVISAELDPPPDPVISWVQNLQLHQPPPPSYDQRGTDGASSPRPQSREEPTPLPAQRAQGTEAEGAAARAGGGDQQGECVSMESMVSLSCPKLQAQYKAGLLSLKSGKVTQENALFRSEHYTQV